MFICTSLKLSLCAKMSKIYTIFVLHNQTALLFILVPIRSIKDKLMGDPDIVNLSEHAGNQRIPSNTPADAYIFRMFPKSAYIFRMFPKSAYIFRMFLKSAYIFRMFPKSAYIFRISAYIFRMFPKSAYIFRISAYIFRISAYIFRIIML